MDCGLVHGLPLYSLNLLELGTLWCSMVSLNQ